MGSFKNFHLYRFYPECDLELAMCVHSVCKCGNLKASEEMKDKLLKILEHKEKKEQQRRLFVKNKWKYLCNELNLE